MNKVYGIAHERYSAVYLPTVYFCAVCRLYPRLPQLALYVEFSSLYFDLSHHCHSPFPVLTIWRRKPNKPVPVLKLFGLKWRWNTERNKV